MSDPASRTETALAFLQSVIRSGEPWTETCYAAVTEALAEHHRLRKALADLVLWFEENDDRASDFGELLVVKVARHVLSETRPTGSQASVPWRCRCTEPAPDGLGVVRIRRPADEPSCHRCGATQAEYEAEMEDGFDPWLA